MRTRGPGYYAISITGPIPTVTSSPQTRRRVRLQPGESQTVELEITPESLSFYDIEMNYVVEPGAFEVMVGTSSREEDLRTAILRVAE